MLWVFGLGAGITSVNVKCKLYLKLVCMFVAHKKLTLFSANKVVY